MSPEKIDALTDGAMKLFSLETDDLYAVLGIQLLGYANPTRAAGVVTFFSAVRKADKAINFIEVLRPGLTQGSGWLDLVHEELKRDGIRYLGEASGDLRQVLCKEDILGLAQQISRDNLQTIIFVIAAALGISRGFESIAATVAVLLLKLGLREFCGD